MITMKWIKPSQNRDCDKMQVWLESGTRQEGVDLIVGDDLDKYTEVIINTEDHFLTLFKNYEILNKKNINTKIMGLNREIIIKKI